MSRVVVLIIFGLALSLTSCGGKDQHNAVQNPDKQNAGADTPQGTGNIPPSTQNITSASETLPPPTLKSNVTIAVIDSGVDLQHKDLRSVAWNNEREIANNRTDDEKNGYVDDMQGWDYTKNNNETIDYSYSNKFSPDVIRFMEISAKRTKGTATAAEEQWRSQKAQDKNFMKQVETYGNYIHGTHVSGITASENSTARIMSLKIIATEQNQLSQQIARTLSIGQDLLTFLLVEIIQRFFSGGGGGGGGSYAASLSKVFQYAGNQGAGVANCSFGITASSLASAIGKGMQTQNQGNMSPHALQNIGIRVASNIGDTLRNDIGSARNTLFVIAAGNAGQNNDQTPTWPANVKTDNAITVAATVGRSQLANFSNYGAQTVEVAAPGVAIYAPVPGDQYLELSGTSMAAPFVSNVASKIRSINSRLSPAETKRIIMETVDKKAFLQGKVSTSGIVNKTRALQAAELSNSMDISAAITKAQSAVAEEKDQTFLRSNTLPGQTDTIFIHAPSLLPSFSD